MSEMLIALPNRDLWRGHKRVEPSSDNVTLGDAPRPFGKLDTAMSNILKVAGIGATTLTCLWCGQQGDDKFMREHLKSAHPSVVNPPTDAELAAAQLAAANEKPASE